MASLAVMGVRCGRILTLNVTGETEGGGRLVTDGRGDGSDGGVMGEGWCAALMMG